jgi:hypothetical protein
MIRRRRSALAPEPKLPPTHIDTARIDTARRREQRALWRLTAWGCAAAVALISAALASQTGTGRERLKLAFNGVAQPSRTAMAAAAERRAEAAQAETRRLAAKLRELSADRDRLGARLAVLERNLKNMTGSIGKQLAAASETHTPAPPEAVPTMLPAIATIKIKPPPRTEPPAIVPLATPASEAVAASKTEAPPPPPAKEAALPEPASPPPATPPPPEAPVKPPVMVEVPMPPVRLAALPPSQPRAPPKPEFGVDLGGALSAAFLRAHWAEVKANFGPLLDGLHPLIAHDRHFSHAPYRLLIGPLLNAAAAARLCAQLAATRAACRPARFAGEPLAQP